MYAPHTSTVHIRVICVLIPACLGSVVLETNSIRAQQQKYRRGVRGTHIVSRCGISPKSPSIQSVRRSGPQQLHPQNLCCCCMFFHHTAIHLTLGHLVLSESHTSLSFATSLAALFRALRTLRVQNCTRNPPGRGSLSCVVIIKFAMTYTVMSA